jgi:BirA family biotin operon repressor/biotin-[acetyl-CoA-carboxylase] ligase
MGIALGESALAAGYRLAAFDRIGSTNTEAMERARAGDPGGLWVFAGEQTAGRGRRGRSWSTPPGNVAASLLTVTRVPHAVAATLGFVAGLALRRAVAPLMAAARPDGADDLRLKWPNDLLAGGAKLAGILLEAEQLPGGRIAVVVGIGVNVATAPTGLPYPATSLAALGAGADAAPDAATVFARLTDAFVAVHADWDEGRGLDRILDEWRASAAGVGRPVSVTIGRDQVTGVFETIDPEGRLVLRAPDGAARLIAAGEVHFASAPLG